MDRFEARTLLADVASGRVAVDAALERFVQTPFDGFEDLDFARVDTHRALRTGDPEVIYGGGKTAEQVIAVVSALRAAHPDRPALITRTDEEMRAALRGEFVDDLLDESLEGRCVSVGPLPIPRGSVTVISAGTSDGPVAAEAEFVVRAFGAHSHRISDVGVAGIHRLLAVRAQLDTADCLVVVAGMDGALPSVVGGLTGVLVAVPTSVGYGASLGGIAALLTMLNSCAPGVVVTNIDNGFGAGVFAARVARQRPRPAS